MKLKSIMTNKKILKGNKLIAEFMGYKFMDYRNCIYFGPEYVVDEIKCNSPTNDDNYAHICSGNRCKNYRNLLYNSSWDWLMPVIKEIGGHDWSSVNIHWGTGATDSFAWCTIEWSKYNKSFKTSDKLNFNEQSLISSVWASIVEFIKWYNKQDFKND